jgi:hypothetical protein
MCLSCLDLIFASLFVHCHFICFVSRFCFALFDRLLGYLYRVPPLKLFILWLVWSTALVQAQFCSADSLTFHVTDLDGVENLIQEALAPNATINVIWNGDIQ